MVSGLIIRREQDGDAVAIRRVHSASFPSVAEAALVDALRDSGHLSVSLVALADDAIVGHVAFSPVSTATGAVGVGLAPVAVVPEARLCGVASALVRAGVSACAEAGCRWVVVLGDPGLYGRFGFTPAADVGLTDEYGGGAAFQVLELMPGSLPVGAGVVRYGPEFASL